jgi:CubicO group peptidase (beta-lactamase class C family)
LLTAPQSTVDSAMMLVMRALLLLAVACSDPIDEAFEDAARVPNITSLSLRQDGVVVREAFYAETDASTPHDVRSVTKTVTSLLVGIAIDSGCLTSVDETLGEVLGDLPSLDPAKAAVTVRHLLTMTSGFAWDENGAIGDYNPWVTSPNQVEFVLARPLATTPGTEFNYNSGALHLLSAIITRACGPTAEFAAQHLFEPLGLTSRTWELDHQRIPNGAAGLQVSTNEMAALGQLLLDRGRVGTTQVVPVEYLDAATAAQIEAHVTSEPPGYGYGMWIGSGPRGSFVLALGYGGQFIVVVPQARAVVVATTDWQVPAAQARADYFQLYAIIVTQLVPAL